MVGGKSLWFALVHCNGHIACGNRYDCLVVPSFAQQLIL